jgi:hypothetical protein
MHEAVMAPLFALLLFAGMLLFHEFGLRLGQRADEPPAGLGAGEGAVFALLGLLLAFTFYGAASRFDARRDLIVQEANAIGTAYLRLDVLPAAVQPALRDLFRAYLDARLAAYRMPPDPAAGAAEQARAAGLQADIWRQAVTAVRAEGALPSAAQIVLPALNEMIDVTTTRATARRTHPPLAIYALLFGMALVSALISGHATAGAKRRTWVHVVAFALSVAATVYVALDLEYPRHGFIRIDAFDDVLVALRAGMK